MQITLKQNPGPRNVEAFIKMIFELTRVVKCPCRKAYKVKSQEALSALRQRVNDLDGFSLNQKLTEQRLFIKQL